MAVGSMTRRFWSRTSLERSSLVELGGGVLLGVGAVDAVDPRGLHQDVGLQLHGLLGGGRVGGDERRAGAAGEDHDAALFQVPPGAAADVRLGHAVHPMADISRVSQPSDSSASCSARPLITVASMPM